MSTASSIEISFYYQADAIRAVDVLLGSGWTFPEGIITYRWDWNDPDYRTASVDEWPKLRDGLWSDLTHLGEDDARQVRLHWDDPDVWVTVGVRAPGVLYAFLGDGGPRLGGCFRWPDYTWWLERLLLPLLRASFNVQGIECSSGQ